MLELLEQLKLVRELKIAYGNRPDINSNFSLKEKELLEEIMNFEKEMEKNHGGGTKKSKQKASKTKDESSGAKR